MKKRYDQLVAGDVIKDRFAYRVTNIVPDGRGVWVTVNSVMTKGPFVGRSYSAARLADQEVEVIR